MRNKDDFDKIVSLVKKRIGFPGDLYKFNPIRRRIEYCMNRIGITDPGEYLEILDNSTKELQTLVLELTINLSYFFRNPETFATFESLCLPTISEAQKIAFWSAGCAAGEEPYTIAIIADKFGLDDVTILGTDIDSQAISRARAATYNQFAVQFVSDELLKNYFQIEDNKYILDKRIATKVGFEVCDLFKTKHKNKFDAIFLRNVLIYLSKPAQVEILKIIKKSLKDNGYLILGKVETMIGIDPEGFFKQINLKERIFQLQ